MSQDKTYTLDDLRQVKGVGKKTIERIKEQFDESEYVSKYDETIHIEPDDLVQGDMLEVMNGIPDSSVDMILTDLPYGTTSCRWDEVIAMDSVWKQYNRVIKDNGAIVLFGSEPFSSQLRNSNIENYRYDWVYRKQKGTGHLNAKKQPLRDSENVMVFYKAQPTYNPQMKYVGVRTKGVVRANPKDVEDSVYRSGISKGKEWLDDGYRYPVTTIENLYDAHMFDSSKDSRASRHPTQKPVPLLEYLIKTYTNENEVVLDSTMGSGSTGVACANTNRKFIGIELDDEYYKIAKERIEKARLESDVYVSTR